MKKPKISLDSAKLKALFVQHVEKILLVLVIGMTLFLIYQGFSLPGLERDRTPQGLLQTSEQMMQFIDEPNRWNEVKTERQEEFDVAAAVGRDRKPADPSQYYLAMRWETPNFPKLSPRTDPEAFAPIHLVVVPTIGPVAYLKDPSEVDPLMPLPSEDGEEPAPKPKPRPKAPKPPRRNNAMGGTDPAALAASGSGSDPMSPAGRGRRGRQSGGDDLIGGMGMPDPAALPGDSPAGIDGMGGAPNQTAVNPESILGFQAMDAAAKEIRAVVVMAVVPFEKQVEEFQKSLAESLDYDPARDSPTYLKYLVQRADVTDDPAAEPAEDKWESLSVNAAEEETANWAGALKEVVDPAYLDERLTQAAPPLMQRDLWPLLSHPEIPLPPRASEASIDERTVPTRPQPGTKAAPGSDVPTLEEFGPNRGAAGFDDAAGVPSMPGMSSPGGVRPGAGMRQVRPRSGGMPGMPGMGADAGIGGGSADISGYGSGGYGSGARGLPGSAPPPKYKLLRFTDTTVEPARKYRYRIKVLLHDPNHPHPNYQAPSPASLDQKVRERIRPLDAKTFWVESKWSEPSPVAVLPSGQQYFAGTVRQPASTPIIATKPPVPNTTHPTGKALAVVWDSTKVVDVAAETDVHRGSILNFVKDARVIHPVTHIVVDLSKYSLSTNAIVADMMGGEEIPLLDKTSKKEPLVAPGEILIFDSQGNLHVRNETEDIEGYRRFLVPEKTEESGADAAGDAANGFGDILDGMPMPGDGPVVRPRRGGP